MLLTSELRGIDPGDVADEYARRGLDRLSDDSLLDAAAAVIAEPKAAAADSFVLHAPLELLARRGLLGLVAEAQRAAVRRRIVWLAATYERAGDPAPAVRGDEYESAADAATSLDGALRSGDLDGIDAGARWLADHGTADDLAPITDTIVTSLAAAAHGPIFLYQLRRTAPRSRAALGLLRPLLREVGRHPDWRVEWIDDAGLGGAAGAGDAARLLDALLATPLLGRPGSDFIFPLVHQVDSTGTAADVLQPVLGDAADAPAVGRAVARAAALSMLHDDVGAAPYGWTHCLTMPQAVAAVAPVSPEPRRALAVAATHVVAFRAGLGTNAAVALTYEPEPPGVDAVEALDASPAVAAAAAHHAGDGAIDDVVAAIAARAGGHEDAHLAKYALACFDAMADDPARSRLYLSAAAYLTAWWRAPG